jgi:hypothetical protein
VPQLGSCAPSQQRPPIDESDMLIDESDMLM